MMTAAKMLQQPRISRPFMASCRSRTPNSTPKTDSRHKSREATVGSASRCAMICRVVADAAGNAACI